MFLCIFSITINTTSATAQRTVRVAYLSEMFGFYTMEENGGYSGYNYDYLMNIAQHTNWKIEFVEISEGSVTASILKAFDMLEAGELDLVGPLSPTESDYENFEVSNRNYGVYRYNIYSARNNYAVTEDNYFLQDSISIALVESFTDLNSKFIQLTEARGLTYDITYVKTHQDSIDMLLNEDVETILNLDMSSNAQYLDYLTTVDRIPFYFASTKGNTDLIAELDEAIRKVEIIEPDIHQILLEKYFGIRYEGNFLFTDEEKAQLENKNSFKVGLLRDMPPYQFINDKGENAGITIEVMDKLSEVIGMTFEVVWFNTTDDLVKATNEHKIDMVGSMALDYELAQNLDVVFTNSYISSGVYWIRNKNEIADPDILYHYVSSNIPFYSDEELTMVLDIKSAMKTMDSNGSVSIFCDPYVAEYYIDSLSLENIETQAVSNVLSTITFGVVSHIDESLIGMLNRAIMFIDSYELDEIIFRNTMVVPEYTLYDVFMDFAIEILIGVSIIATLIIWYINRNSKKFKELSRRDSLTKLYNSGYFHEYAESKTKRITKGCLVLIDIDYFKQVNDTYGHQAGDTINKSVASRLKEHFRDYDMIARLGGDEFVILLEELLPIEELELRCSKVLEQLADTSNEVPVTLSIGGYIFKGSTAYKDLYHNADQELYKVKEKGRNGFSFTLQE